jgi:hypothetical protein
MTAAGLFAIGQTPTKPFQVYANGGLQFAVHQDIANTTAHFMMEGGTSLSYLCSQGATNSIAAYSTTGTGAHIWYQNGNTNTEKARIDTGGRFQVGGTAGAGRLCSQAASWSENALQLLSATTGGGQADFCGIQFTTAGTASADIYTNEAHDLSLTATSLSLKTGSSGISGGTSRMTVAAAGTVNVVGTFTAGTKTFRIDHPLPAKTDTHYLLHSSIEGPQADLSYRGRADLVSGTVDVNIDTAAGMTDGTFVLLCGDVQCFTSNEDGWTALKGSVTGNVLTITAQDNTCTDTVSWMVVGERKDAKMIESEWADDDGKLIVETLKSAHE